MTSRQLPTLVALTLMLAPATTAKPLAAQPLPITLSQYNVALATAQSDAAAAASGSISGQQSAIKALGLVAQVPVRTAPDEIVFADNRPILAQMQAAATASDEQQTWAQIAVEIQDVRSALPNAAVDRQAATAAAARARAVLSTSEFASEPIVPNSIAEKIGDAIARFIRYVDRAFRPIGSGENSGAISPIFAYALLIVIGLAAISLIVYFVVTTIRDRARASSMMASADSGLALTSEERELVATHNYARLRELASEAGEQGDFRSAFRLTFLATLVYLNAEGAIRLDRSKTNWEYLRSLPGQSEIREYLRPLVRDFDRIWYGFQDATASDYERATAAYDSVRMIVGDTLARPDAPASGQSFARAVGSR